MSRTTLDVIGMVGSDHTCKMVEYKIKNIHKISWRAAKGKWFLNYSGPYAVPLKLVLVPACQGRPWTSLVWWAAIILVKWLSIKSRTYIRFLGVLVRGSGS